jgi:hypothetical protein
LALLSCQDLQGQLIIKRSVGRFFDFLRTVGFDSLKIKSRIKESSVLIYFILFLKKLKNRQFSWKNQWFFWLVFWPFFSIFFFENRDQNKFLENFEN